MHKMNIYSHTTSVSFFNSTRFMVIFNNRENANHVALHKNYEK